MKIILYFVLFMAGVTMLCSCNVQRICEAFDMRYAMFVPAKMEKNDTLILYSNRSDSTIFQVAHKEMSLPYDYNINQNRGCQNTLILLLESAESYFKDIQYTLSYSNNNAKTVDFNFSITQQKPYQLYSLKLYPQANGKVSASQTIVDSVVVNGEIYKDVIVIEDGEKPITKIYLAKEQGVVCIIENSGREWALNKWGE